MTAPDPNEVLFGNTVPSFQFERYGDTCQGIITDIVAQKQTDKKTGEPKFWPSGDPMWMAVVTLQTQERDPSIAEDDGKRRVFIRGRSLTDATRDAVKDAGKKKLEKGALMSVTYTSDGPAERGNNPPKLYSVAYQVMGGFQQPVQQPQAALPQQTTYAQPVQQPVQQAANTIDLSTLAPEARALIEQMQKAAQPQ